MTSLWQAPAIIVVITWLNAPPGTLGAAARQEALRRSMMPQSVLSLSLYDWPPAAAGGDAGASIPQPAAMPVPAGVPPSGSAALPPQSPGSRLAERDESRRDEAWWRARMAAARSALSRGETMAEAMQSHVNALRNDVVSRDDPAQQAVLRQRLATALAELERLTDQIAAERKAILDIQEEARRLGVPAEWIRDGLIFSSRSP